MGGAKGTHAMIKDLAEYDELATMADVAEENLGKMRFGSHWLLRIKIKQRFGVDVSDREQAIKFIRRLCDEFITAFNVEVEEPVA
jgi:hypothetical protein